MLSSQLFANARPGVILVTGKDIYVYLDLFLNGCLGYSIICLIELLLKSVVGWLVLF